MTELESANSSNMEFQLKLNKPLNPISILNQTCHMMSLNIELKLNKLLKLTNELKRT